MAGWSLSRETEELTERSRCLQRAWNVANEKLPAIKCVPILECCQRRVVPGRVGDDRDSSPASAGPGHLRALADCPAAECPVRAIARFSGVPDLTWIPVGELLLRQAAESDERDGAVHMVDGRPCSNQLSNVACRAPHRLIEHGAARSGRLQRERIICFDLFFELLGWNQCSCCVNSCQHRGSCRKHQPPQPIAPQPIAPQPVAPQPVAPSVPAEAGADAGGAAATRSRCVGDREVGRVRASTCGDEAGESEPETRAVSPAADPVHVQHATAGRSSTRRTAQRDSTECAGEEGARHRVSRAQQARPCHAPRVMGLSRSWSPNG